MRRAWIAAIVPILVLAAGGLADAAPAATRAPVPLQVPAKVQVTLQALDKLRQMGYHWTTDAGALKAIKHWQKVNGLVVDGDVGPQTLASLGISTGATATKPAVRLNPPAPVPDVVCDVECIIRDVWPDDLEDRAVRIAWRESNWTPTVRNYCCIGLFQLYWSVHRGWMAELGVTSSDQLFDARTNAEMAYQLYLRSGGWSPWNCYGQCTDVRD